MALPTVIHNDPVPLRVEEDGGLRVGNTRVHLEIMLHDFRSGSSPEAIVDHFPTLDLADVYTVIGYCLRHPEEIEDYLRRRDREAEEIRKKIEAAQGPPRVTREMLQARWAELEKKRAAAGQ
jgi:uncharacterized protein (DUF433 family)